MVEVGIWSLPTKVPPFFKKKNRNQKKKWTVSDWASDSLPDTVEFFDLRIFSSGKLLWEISASEFNQGHSKYSQICPKHFIVPDLYEYR
jgi:hypothetical protein